MPISCVEQRLALLVGERHHAPFKPSSGHTTCLLLVTIRQETVCFIGIVLLESISAGGQARRTEVRRRTPTTELHVV